MKVKEVTLANGLVAELYDRNGDGDPDVATYSHPAPDGHRPFPIIYEIDMDFDGAPDYQVFDTHGQGLCASLILEPLSEETQRQWLAQREMKAPGEENVGDLFR